MTPPAAAAVFLSLSKHAMFRNKTSQWIKAINLTVELVLTQCASRELLVSGRKGSKF